MISPQVEGLLDKQVSKKSESVYLYLEFSNFFDSRNLNDYFKEEIDHAMLINNYLHKVNKLAKVYA